LSVLDDDGDVAPADLGHISAVAAAGLDHADRIAVAVLSGDRGMSSAELSNADNVVATALIGIGKVAKTVLTNDPSVVLTLLRVDRAIAATILIMVSRLRRPYWELPNSLAAPYCSIDKKESPAWAGANPKLRDKAVAVAMRNIRSFMLVSRSVF